MHKPTICAIRGAICVAKDEPLYIEAAACRLYKAILEQNNLDEENVASLLITQTSDLKSRNPATGLRKGGYCSTTPLFCMQELKIEGMLERVIRMLLILNFHTDQTKAVFMDGAERLRPDLQKQ
ncbi:Chorismate mutase AroH [bioreactor metagenome]|uniref:Chorismate mutase AroH n=1 Tax=bioreactor metagenome TaxID=1076179 RepID=A0A644X5P0_9ZZZZ|nr:chorismate mutase [Sphaerochaeta associata]MEA5030124.1 chorismate mutase [Sphaerochaeta associata]